VTQFDVELHDLAAQIDVAVLQARFFIGEGCVGGQKRGQLGFVENAQLFGDQLDFAGRNVFIDGAGIAQLDRAGDGDDVLVAQGFGLFVDCGIALGVDDDLGYAGAIAQVHKNETAQVAPLVDPAHEYGLFAGVGSAQRSAHMSSS